MTPNNLLEISNKEVKTMEVGYARCSTEHQKLDVQLEKLSFCEKVFCEKRSGRDFDNREQLKLCLDFVRDGDVLCITKTDRLARSITDFFNIVKMLNDKGVTLRVIDQNIDTGSSSSVIMLSLLSAFAEFENNIRRERQLEGLEKAKKLGIKLGRRPSVKEEDVIVMKEMKNNGSSVSDIAKKFGVSRASIYNYIH